MRICHISPHLPPDQAANALLPWHLGRWAREAGDLVSYVAHPPRHGGAPIALPGPVTWIPRRADPTWARVLRLGGIHAALSMARAAWPAIASADLVHAHSNGLIVEVAAFLARRRGVPYVLTMYGTEIWHYARKRVTPDLFTAAYRGATRVTFYSQGLIDRARDLGLPIERAEVIYPPVGPEFTALEATARAAARAELGIAAQPLLVNVKRLHPLAGQRTLVEAMPAILRAHPGTHLVVAGTGPLGDELAALADALGVGAHVTWAGLLDNAAIARLDAAADLFVLPSELEACPTVALEALATGTPVVSTDNPGGVELGRLFGDDVTVVPRGDAAALAAAVNRALTGKRRTRPRTAEVLADRFSAGHAARRHRAIYEAACRERESKAR